MPDEEYLRVFGKSREEMLTQTMDEIRTARKKKDKTLAKALFEKLKKAYIGEDIFWANEVGTNIFVATVMALFCAILILTVILAEVGIYDFDTGVLTTTVNIINAFLFLGIVLCIVFKGEKHWLKYMMMIMLCIVIGALSAFLGFRVAISLAIPVIISTKYLSGTFTKFISAIAGICMFVGTALYAVLGLTVDLNYVVFNSDSILFDSSIKNLSHEAISKHDYIVNLLLRSFLPNFLQFILIAYICCIIAKWGHKAIVDQAESAKEFARVDTELGLARDIQEGILPSIFPAFPDRSDIDIYATMDAAKEVGGDFYDFFLIDDSHLGVVIADVSDKGVPAALFMMIGKTLIKSQLLLGKSPNEAFRVVNNQLCENNEVGLFITAWAAVINLKTGEVTASNAGHEYPAVCNNGEYRFIKHKAGFVLAGVEDMEFTEYKFNLVPGDSFFLYTDGVTEANNVSGEQFGKDRILEVLNKVVGKEQKDILSELRKNIDEFVGEASQHDDMTMVGVTYKGPEA